MHSIKDPCSGSMFAWQTGCAGSGWLELSMSQLQKLGAQDPEGYAFPLPDASGPYLCTQGIGGRRSVLGAAPRQLFLPPSIKRSPALDIQYGPRYLSPLI